MVFRNIRWRIAFPYVMLILLIMLGLTIYLSTLLQADHLDRARERLKADTYFAGQSIESLLAQGGHVDDLDDTLVAEWAEALGLRVTVIRADGFVLAESMGDRQQMDNQLNRPEVRQAFATGWGAASRLSRTLGYEMLYGAVPFRDGEEGEALGAVRLAVPMSQIYARIAHLRRTIAVFAIIAAVLAVLLASLIAERSARPVRQLTGVVERMAQGDLGARLLPTTEDEVGRLTVMFNRMAEQLQDKVTTLSTHRRHLAAILEQMADGIIITDDRGQVRMINRAAARLLGTTQNAALDRSFIQVVRDHQLVQVWQQCNEWDEEQIATVEVDRNALFVRIAVTPIRERDNRTCLVILQDLTQIRRLESVRRDFISNVSHDLRAPLASLRALVATLRDGALDDPLAAQHNLDRMEAEVDSLTRMVGELLELSREESGQSPLQVELVPVRDLILPALDRLRAQAVRSDLDLDVDLPPDLPPVMADVERIRRVVTNLVQNAIKFTPPGGSVRVFAEPDLEEGEVIIAVRDTGVGISGDDLSHIFERFYKADRASRGSGTGLGLAIARQLVQVHKGRIWVDSAEGQGSTFYFSLPSA
jgi:two-component system phosphate regulon sensor histidine kinase PhoR